MAKKNNQNASFIVRFNQQIFKDNNETNIQWRGKITHVQDGDEKRFSDFNDALLFMQQKLGEVTEEATKDESSETKENIIQKSFAMWKTIKDVGPKVIKETLKDPKKQITHIQEELHDKISVFSEEISDKVKIDQWKVASKSDVNQLQKDLASLASEVKKLSKKIDSLKN